MKNTSFIAGMGNHCDGGREAERRTATVGIAVALAFLVFAGSGPAAAQRRVNEAAVCVNGYRTTHVVRSHGRDYGGVILRCRR